MKLPSLSQEILKSKSLVFSYSISMVADRLLPSRNSRQVQVTCFSCFYLHKAFVADRQIDLQLSSAFVLCLRKSIAWPTMRVSGMLGIFFTLYPYPYPNPNPYPYPNPNPNLNPNQQPSTLNTDQQPSTPTLSPNPQP